MATNGLSGRVHGGSRYGGQVISAAGRSGSPTNIVHRSSGGRSPFVYTPGSSTVGYQQGSGTSPSRYPQRMPSGYVVTRAEAQNQAGK